jgi:hypothetical protein
MKSLFKLFSVILLCIFAIGITYAQDTKADKKAAKAAQVKNMIKSTSYVFVANSVSPMRGGMRQLNGTGYDLVISKDRVVAFLPYFGRMYSAPLDASEGGIKLTSTDFVYHAKANKKGNWDITIKPKAQSPSGANDVDLFRLSVSSDGNASLQVTGTNRDPISFDGYIEPKGDTTN